MLAARRDAALAWLDVRDALERSAHLGRLAAELAAQRDVALARARAEEGASREGAALEGELALVRDRALVAARDERRARAGLARWIGDAASRPIGALPAVRAAPSGPAPADHPLLQAAASAAEVALREAEQARAERRPDWSWQLMYGWRGADRSDLLTAQFTMDLPVNRRDRQDRRVAASAAGARREALGAEDVRRMLEAEQADARAELAGAEARLEEIERSRLPAARALEAVTAARYAAGRDTLEAVWQARRAAVEAELDRELIRIDRERALQRLAYLHASPRGETP
jgi:outer membrane protein TolC